MMVWGQQPHGFGIQNVGLAGHLRQHANNVSYKNPRGGAGGRRIALFVGPPRIFKSGLEQNDHQTYNQSNTKATQKQVSQKVTKVVKSIMQVPALSHA